MVPHFLPRVPVVDRERYLVEQPAVRWCFTLAVLTRHGIDSAGSFIPVWRRWRRILLELTTMKKRSAI